MSKQRKPYLVTQSKSSKLLVILEFLNADRACSARDLEASNDRLASAGEGRRALAFAASAGLKLVKESSKCDFFDSRVDVEHAIKASGEKDRKSVV